MACPVKNYLSGMTGLPTLTGQAGMLIPILDACLVDGFNLITLDSLAVSGNVLTGTKSGHGYWVDQIVLISGANESALNGEWRIATVSGTTFTAAAPGVGNTTGTGTISAKAAPAGWTKSYSGTNKAVYRSSNVSSTRMYLRVDDTGTVVSRVVGYETMTDVDTGTGPFPTAAQISGGGSWHKSSTTDATSRSYALFADSDGFFLQIHGGNTAHHFYGFGDFTSEKSGDAYRCFLASVTSATAVGSYSFSSLLTTSGGSTSAMIYAPRSYTQIGSAVTLETFAMALGPAHSGFSSGGLQYPSPASNGLVLTQPSFKETSGPVRALAIPGLYHTPQALPLADRDKIPGVTGLGGRTVMMLVTSSAGGGFSRAIIDITGPWR